MLRQPRHLMPDGGQGTAGWAVPTSRPEPGTSCSGAAGGSGGAQGSSPLGFGGTGDLPCTHPVFSVRGSAPQNCPPAVPRARSVSPAPPRALRRLTVSVLAVNALDAAVGQHLDVEADAHVAVEAPQPLDTQQIVAVSGGVAALGREASNGAGEKSRVPAALAEPGGEASRGGTAPHRPWPQQPQQQRRQQRRGERHPGLGDGKCALAPAPALG